MRCMAPGKRLLRSAPLPRSMPRSSSLLRKQQRQLPRRPAGTHHAVCLPCRCLLVADNDAYQACTTPGVFTVLTYELGAAWKYRAGASHGQAGDVLLGLSCVRRTRPLANGNMRSRLRLAVDSDKCSAGANFLLPTSLEVISHQAMAVLSACWTYQRSTSERVGHALSRQRHQLFA